MRKIISRKDAKDLGLKRFYTGAPCKRGHNSERNVSRGVCIECHNELTRRKYWENIDYERSRSAQYYSENKEKCKAYTKKYSAENKDRIKASRKNYKSKNRELIARKNREYNEANRDTIKARKRRYYDENRDRYRSYVRNRRALIRGAEGTHSKDDIILILEKQNWLCANPMCSKDLQKVQRHVDHIVPLSKGGSNLPSNLQCLCGKCNRSKHDMDFDDWLKRMENKND